MSRPQSASSILRKEKQSYAPVTKDIAGNLILPNLSGDHVRSIKRAAPVNGVDLVNKDYVDTALTGYLPLTGGTLSGILYCDGNVGGLGLDVLKSAFISINLEVGQDLTVDRNIIVGGTVDGIDVGVDVAANTVHRANNSQAHSDYLKNNADDITSGSLTIDKSLRLSSDKSGPPSDGEIVLGAGTDARIYYNGTNLIIDPDRVGSGRVLIGATADDGLTCSDLIVDTTTLVVNKTGYTDKVGIGTATPDGKLHIKGGDLIFEDDGSGLPYGGFYGNNISWSSTQFGGGGTFVIINTLTGGEVNKTTFQNTQELLIATAGRYLVTWALTAEGQQRDNHIEAGIGINGVCNVAGRNHVHISQSNKEQAMSGTAILDLAATNTLSVMITNVESDNITTVEHVTLTAVHIGGT